MKRLIAALLFAVLFLSGAMAEPTEHTDTGVNMVLGEKTGGYYSDIELYYESGEGIDLTTVTRTVYVPDGGSLIEKALDELFKPAGSEFSSPMPGEAAVKSVEYGCGVVTVKLDMNLAGIYDEGEIISVYTAISNTLTNLDGVEYVNILVNSRCESIGGMPVGLIAKSEASASEVRARYQAESTNFFDAGMPINRTAALYFPSNNGQWLLPDVREITFSDDNYAGQLITELIAGTSKDSTYADFLSGGITTLTEPCRMSVNSAGERILDITLSGTLRDYLILQGIPEWQLAGALTLTMCSFVPELDAVRITIGDEVVDRVNIKGVYHDFENGLMRRSDFYMYAGSVGTLYFAADGESLSGVLRAVSSERAVSAYTLLTQLISGPSSSDVGLISTMPAGVTAKDILGIEITGGTAVVNMTANFYRLSQLLNDAEERLLIYSMVNTLCTIPGVSAVQLLIEGERIETLRGGVYLMHELLPNPGIIK